MNTFSPNPVDPVSWRGWLREALALTRRQWPILVTLVVTWILAHRVIDRLPAEIADVAGTLIGLGLALLALSLFVVIAEAADHSVGVAGLIWSRLRASWMGLALYLALTICVALVFGVVLVAGSSFLDTPQSAAEHGGPGVSASMAFGTHTALLFFIIHMTVGYWFVFPLLVLADLPLLKTLLLALEAFSCNMFVWKLGAVCALVAVLAPPLFIVGIAPVLGAVLYVSWRHVFLGQRDNLPQPQPAPLLQASSASAGGAS